ncbi:hypothetical protein [Thiolapillus sp.]|uniref:hypothetical protein n=1 Tax=Thiolapillus sp. TaxID=2017437 RepID=UPI003AF7E993
MTDLIKLFKQARDGTLPPDFDQWALANEFGRSVAHVAAIYGHLPPDFDRWEISDATGCTIAHEAAYHGHLPPDFYRWTLATNNGITVRDVYKLGEPEE